MEMVNENIRFAKLALFCASFHLPVLFVHSMVNSFINKFTSHYIEDAAIPVIKWNKKTNKMYRTFTVSHLIDHVTPLGEEHTGNGFFRNAVRIQQVNLTTSILKRPIEHCRPF